MLVLLSFPLSSITNVQSFTYVTEPQHITSKVTSRHGPHIKVKNSLAHSSVFLKGNFFSLENIMLSILLANINITFSFPKHIKTTLLKQFVIFLLYGCTWLKVLTLDSIRCCMSMSSGQVALMITKGYCMNILSLSSVQIKVSTIETEA